MAAAMVNFPGMTEEQLGAIQEWVKFRIEEHLPDRLTMASRAIEFVNDIDSKQKEVVDKVKFEADRAGQIVSDFNSVKADLDTVFADTRSKMESLFQETKAFAAKTDETAGGMEAKVNEFSPEDQALRRPDHCRDRKHQGEHDDRE